MRVSGGWDLGVFGNVGVLGGHWGAGVLGMLGWEYLGTLGCEVLGCRMLES